MNVGKLSNGHNLTEKAGKKLKEKRKKKGKGVVEDDLSSSEHFILGQSTPFNNLQRGEKTKTIIIARRIILIVRYKRERDIS